jgi:voltage-gated potassium channel Kch
LSETSRSSPIGDNGFAPLLNAVSAGLAQNLVSHFIYFSSVTLTTLGYGDIVPVFRPARMFATLEATAGQLYVAIVIARLVGLHISQKR